MGCQVLNIFSNSLGKTELAAVEKVFKSRWLGRGKECADFEKDLAAWFSADEILVTNNCTAAIYVGMRALGIGPGDEVIISTVGFVACLSAIKELGATPIFADVDPRTLNILPSEIQRLKNCNTKAVVILHYGGHPAPMREICEACDGIPIIEDSACSVASKYHGIPCGTIGDVGAWSFDPMKILCTIDGGALWIKPEYRERAKTLRYLGLHEGGGTGLDKLAAGSSRWWEYSLIEPSGRFISNDVSAAIGKIQLKKLPTFIARRREIWQQYMRGLHGTYGLLLPPEPAIDCESSYYLFWIQTEHRDALADYLKRKGIYTTFRYFPLHLAAGTFIRLPRAEYANEVTLNLPLHQNLTDADVQQVISSVRGFYEHARF